MRPPTAELRTWCLVLADAYLLLSLDLVVGVLAAGSHAKSRVRREAEHDTGRQDEVGINKGISLQRTI